MKKIVVLFLIGLLQFSCSSDSSMDAPTVVDFTIPYSTTGNYWTYDVNTENVIDRDSLYIGNDTIINAKTYKKMKVKNDIAFGFFSNSLRNNGVKVSGNKLLLSGDFSLGTGQNSPINLDLTLEDFIAFDADAPLNGNPSTRSGTIQETINGNPLTINYTLKSVGGQNIANYTSLNGDIYSDVKTGKIVLSASISTTQVIAGFPITFVILPQQNVLVSEQFVAKNIGVVHTHTITTYTLNANLPPEIVNELGIPTTSTVTQDEFLDTYLIN